MPCRSQLITLAFGALLLATASGAGLTKEDPLARVIAGEHRTADFTERDQWRNPHDTLSFFGLARDMTVVEIWPGGGWYTEILAPYLKETGTFYAAHFPADTDVDFYRESRARYEEKLAADSIYAEVQLTTFSPGTAHDIAPAGSVDRVFTFRNLHNFYMSGGSAGLTAALEAFYDALRPGGVLGVVDHRLPEEAPDSAMEDSGYIKQSLVIELAESAGFVLAGVSEVNANPADEADHPAGVWTLPPTLRLGEEDRDHYKNIGESDRFTLKFRKPED